MGGADAIPRRRLAGRIADALDGGSVVVVAPAGYGKTTALAEAVGVSPARPAWLSCSPSDRDPGRLLVHLVGSVRRAVPGAADVLGERLDVATERVDPGLAVQALESARRGFGSVQHQSVGPILGDPPSHVRIEGTR